MLGDNEGGYIDVDGAHWWLTDGHDARAVWAGWVEKEVSVVDYLAEGGLGVEEFCEGVDESF